jgi:hypothetical protein
MRQILSAVSKAIFVNQPDGTIQAVTTTGKSTHSLLFDLLEITYYLILIVVLGFIALTLWSTASLLQLENPLVVLWHYTGGYLVYLYINSTNDGKLNVCIFSLFEVSRFVLPRIWSNLFVTSTETKHS